MKIKFLTLFLITLFAVNYQTSAQETTQKLLENAQKLSKKEGKSIFIKF